MSAYSTAVLATSPTAYYRLDETSGTAATDLTGNGYTAQYQGTFILTQPGAIPADSDTCASFDGTSGILQLPYSLNFYLWTAFSLLYWIEYKGSWSNIAITCDGTTTLYYTNGSLQGSVNPPAAVLIGGNFEYSGNATTGHLDEVALYKNTVLSAATIYSLYWTAAALYHPLTLTVSGRDGVLSVGNRRI